MRYILWLLGTAALYRLAAWAETNAGLAKEAERIDEEWAEQNAV